MHLFQFRNRPTLLLLMLLSIVPAAKCVSWNPPLIVFKCVLLSLRNSPSSVSEICLFILATSRINQRCNLSLYHHLFKALGLLFSPAFSSLLQRISWLLRPDPCSSAWELQIAVLFFPIAASFISIVFSVDGGKCSSSSIIIIIIIIIITTTTPNPSVYRFWLNCWSEDLSKHFGWFLVGRAW